ncbi:MAG: CBS domain-containing protein [Myxococcales bacterium]|nr:CBS domain-containing protein [Myxococcales bacterium]
MTAMPLTVRPDLSLSAADKLMHEHNIRHLPVLSGGRLVGLVSQRDVRLIETLRDVDPKVVSVEEAMSQDIYEISPETPLEEVASNMASHKYGSAVVVEGGKVVGIFTTVDAMKALVELLHGRKAH